MFFKGGRVMSTLYLLGYGFGLLFVIALIFFVIITTDKSMKTMYDERQKIIQGRGYKYGFFTLCILNIFIVGTEERLSKYMEHGLLVFLSMAIALLVFTGYCIFNEAYIGLNEKPSRAVIALLFIAAINIFNGIMNYSNHRLIKDGVIKTEAINLVCGFLMIAVVVMIGIKKLIDKKKVA